MASPELRRLPPPGRPGLLQRLIIHPVQRLFAREPVPSIYTAEDLAPYDLTPEELSPVPEYFRGFQVRQTRRAGIEMMVRTSKPNHYLLWSPAAFWLLLMVLIWSSRPVPHYQSYDARFDGTADAFGIMFFVSVACLLARFALSALLKPDFFRIHQVETLEIRPDGLVLNRRPNGFFRRADIFWMGVNADPEQRGSDFCHRLMLILGTTEVPVFEGMDKIMAAVVSKTLEDAKRQVWREEGD